MIHASSAEERGDNQVQGRGALSHPTALLADDVGDDSLGSCHRQMLAGMAALETFPAVAL